MEASSKEFICVSEEDPPRTRVNMRILRRHCLNATRKWKWSKSPAQLRHDQPNDQWKM